MVGENLEYSSVASPTRMCDVLGLMEADYGGSQNTSCYEEDQTRTAHAQCNTISNDIMMT